MAPLLALAPLRLEARAVAGGAPDAHVARTGAGPRRAGAAAGRLRAEHAGRCAAVVVTGVAGALDAGLSPGDLVVADRVIDATGDTIAVLPSAGLLAAALRRAGLPASVGTVVSSERLARRADRGVLSSLGAAVVDMESAALLREPWDRPTAVVRAVADTPARELISVGTFSGGLAALRALRAAAPVLSRWAAVTGPRSVVVAAPRSFCAGVDRAIETVRRAVERFGAPVYVRRQIVHNTHVVADLEGIGARFVHELDEVPDGATVVFSAHGVAPGVRAAAAARRLTVVDATCPLVAKVHHEIRRFDRQGYQVVLVGHAGHDEVEGSLGEASSIQLVSTPAEAAAVTAADPNRVAYVTQTTLAPDETSAVVDALRARYPALAGPAASDICYATHNRQRAVRSIAADVDVVLVVGSANSSNATRLVEVARRAGVRAERIDDASDIDLAWLEGARSVGLTAGASTPESLVTDAIAALAGLGTVTVTEQAVQTETITFSLPPEVR